ncbi:GNAT superfamily N-acetyltransferase [Allocatelliglobosispora scoriae]|uniref:GNAT superfamily N-acetyltransferase n=1 Tax=Allocatelliglobosispora scoriae TaxID=643052 RepID=A0A841C637_9ACTN|nr:GNAT family N-acetyltransferase [Allocatelliglobosispora scoriae]MBB5874542.1 GNAT superfamily N-acetyltransferase [Allocatelliglobosispora scoriae]
MTDVQLRDMTIDDVPAVARIRAAAYPWMVASVDNQRNWFRTVRPQARAMRLVAEVGGEVVGFGTGGFNLSTAEQAAAEVNVAVLPDARRQGTGTALYASIEAHLREIGARRVRAYVPDEPANLSWAAGHGYAEGARDRYSELRTGSLPPMPPIPAGVELRSIAEVGPEAVYALDMAASIDEPGDMTYDGLPYELWLHRYWQSPDMQHEASTVVVVDGVPACGTFLEGDPATGRCTSTGTCTLRDYRGRGLAKLAKSAALRKAHEAGLHTAITCNDYTNGPMVAVNDWLGYRVTAAEWSMLKQLS